MIYLLDTNILSAFVRDPAGPAALRLAEVGEQAAVTSVVVAGELRYGCRRKGSERLSERVEAVLRAIEILPLTVEASGHYGEIRHYLEAKGTPIGQNDLWIAAEARARGAVLVTDNIGEFERVPDLVVENWLRA